MNAKEIMMTMLEGPLQIEVVICNYRDGSQRCYTFSCEEYRDYFLSYLNEAGQELDMVSYAFYTSLMDADSDVDYKLYGVWH